MWPDSFNLENSQKPWKNAKSTILIFFQILEFQGNEVCFWYSFYHWSIVVLSITLNFSKIGPTSGHNLEMGAWSQKLVIILYLVIVLWSNGTYGKAGGIFIRKLKFSTEFGKVGKNEVKSPSVHLSPSSQSKSLELKCPATIIRYQSYQM